MRASYIIRPFCSMREFVFDLDDQGKYNQGTQSPLLFEEKNVTLHFIPFPLPYLVF